MRKLFCVLLTLALALAAFPLSALAQTSTVFYGWKADGSFAALEVDTNDTSQATLNQALDQIKNDPYAGLLINDQSVTLTEALNLEGKTLLLNNSTLTVADGMSLKANGVYTLGTGKLKASGAAALAIGATGLSAITLPAAASALQYQTNNATGAALTALTLPSGTFTKPAAVTEAITLTGDASLNAPLTLASYDKLTLASGTFTAGSYGLTLSSNSSLTVLKDAALSLTGALTSNGGVITNNASITGSGTLALTGASKLTNSLSISLSGITLGHTSSLVNNSGATLFATNLTLGDTASLRNDGSITASSTALTASGSTIVNNGAFAAGLLNNMGLITDNAGRFTYNGNSPRPGNIYDYSGGHFPGNPGGVYPGYGVMLTASHAVYPGYGALAFSSTGSYSRFEGFMANGAMLTKGVDYTVENIGGNARITVNESRMQALSGSVKFTAIFSNVSASATVQVQSAYIPDDTLLDPPKTGDPISLLGLTLVIAACALTLKAKRLQKSDL